MEVILNEKNPLFTLEKDVKKFCEPIFEILDLKYFSYGKFYNNGNCILLSTNKNVFLNHFDKKYQLTVPPSKETESKKEVLNLIPIDHSLEKIIEDEHSNFDHGSMIDYIKKSENYYEMFCFVAKKEAKDPEHKFLNHTNIIKSFSKNMMESFKVDLKSENENYIKLPDKMVSKISTNRKGGDGHPIFHKENIFYLTKRQLFCMALIGQGKTTKEIGKILTISSKTVEFHLNVIKNKIGLFRKSDLQKISIKNDLPDYPMFDMDDL